MLKFTTNSKSSILAYLLALFIHSCLEWYGGDVGPFVFKIVFLFCDLEQHKSPRLNLGSIQFSSVQFSCSVVSDSLRTHGLQHTRPPCPSPTPGVHSNSCPSIGDAIQPSHPLSSPSPPAPNPSQHQGLFQ